MTARQQLKYLEDQARQTETQQEQQQDLEQQTTNQQPKDEQKCWKRTMCHHHPWDFVSRYRVKQQTAYAATLE